MRPTVCDDLDVALDGPGFLMVASEGFQLLTREQRTAAAVAPLGLENLQDRFGQVTAARAGLFGDLPPELPEIFPGLGLPGGETDFAAGPTGRQLFPDQPEVAAAFDRGATGPSAVELARQRLGIGSEQLGRLRGVDLALLTTRRGFEGSPDVTFFGDPSTGRADVTKRRQFIEDLLGVDEVSAASVEGLTLAQFQEISGITRGAPHIFGTLRSAAGLSGPAPTEADLSNLLGERREQSLQRERDTAAQAETDAEAARAQREAEAEESRKKRVTEARSFTGRRLFQ